MFLCPVLRALQPRVTRLNPPQPNSSWWGVEQAWPLTSPFLIEMKAEPPTSPPPPPAAQSSAAPRFRSRGEIDTLYLSPWPALWPWCRSPVRPQLVWTAGPVNKTSLHWRGKGASALTLSELFTLALVIIMHYMKGRIPFIIDHCVSSALELLPL